MSDDPVVPPEHDEALALSIGAVFGGPHSPWKEPVTAWMCHVADQRQGVDSPLNVNVVFHIAGSIHTPDFKGVRSGTFRKRDSHLMIQVALPSSPPADPEAYLRDLTIEAVDEAERWAAKRAKHLQLTSLHQFVRRL